LIKRGQGRLVLFGLIKYSHVSKVHQSSRGMKEYAETVRTNARG
jgi:hypothetical protein